VGELGAGAEHVLQAEKYSGIFQEYEQEVENLEQELTLSREKEGVYLTSHKAASRTFNI
jgi:hypothetical protein